MNPIIFEESIRSTVAVYWGIEKYKHIMETARSKDISKDSDFQKYFTSYYGLRRDGEWRAEYYRI